MYYHIILMEENKYKNGKIYKIISPSNLDLVYFGSTISKLCKRMGQHREQRNHCVSKKILDFEDAVIVLVENYPCNSKEEWNKKEAEYILNNDCINKQVPGRTREEYREQKKDFIKKLNDEYVSKNRDKVNEHKRSYARRNKEKMQEYRKNNNTHKQPITCVCGSVLSKRKSWETLWNKKTFIFFRRTKKQNNWCLIILFRNHF